MGNITLTDMELKNKLIKDVNECTDIDSKIRKMRGASKHLLGDTDIKVGTEDIIITIPQRAENCRPVKSDKDYIKITNDYKEFVLYVDGSDAAKCISPFVPYNANLRNYNPKSSSVAGQMKTCMGDSSKNNLGDNSVGVIINTNGFSVEDDESKNYPITLTFSKVTDGIESIMGVGDGGTLLGTLRRLEMFGELKPGHIVKLTIRDYNTPNLNQVQRDKCIINAANLNNVKSQNPQNVALQRGNLEYIIQDLPENYQNLVLRKDASSQKDGKVLLELKDICYLFGCLSNSEHKSLYIKNTKICNDVISEFENKDKFKYEPYRHLLKDILDCIKYIEYTWFNSLIDEMSISPKYAKESFYKLMRLSDCRASKENPCEFKFSAKKYNNTVFSSEFPDIKPENNIETKIINATDEFFEDLFEDLNKLEEFTSYLRSLKLGLSGSGNLNGLVACIISGLNCNLKYNKSSDTYSWEYYDIQGLLNAAMPSILTNIYDGLVSKQNDNKIRNLLEKDEIWKKISSSIETELRKILLNKNNVAA